MVEAAEDVLDAAGVKAPILLTSACEQSVQRVEAGTGARKAPREVSPPERRVVTGRARRQNERPRLYGSQGRLTEGDVDLLSGGRLDTVEQAAHTQRVRSWKK
jgi:hypothetical protein